MTEGFPSRGWGSSSFFLDELLPARGGFLFSEQRDYPYRRAGFA
jgi:hypothetical protein